MPVKRRNPKERSGDVSEVAWALLTDQMLLNPLTGAEEAERFVLAELGIPTDTSPSLEQLWQRHGAGIVETWAEEKPGTRPSCWWKWSAPEKLPKGEAQAAFLARHGLLLPGERRGRT